MSKIGLPKPSDRLAIHKKALCLYDIAARLVRADATSESCAALASAARALQTAQWVDHGPNYVSECADANRMICAAHDLVLKVRIARGEVGQ